MLCSFSLFELYVLSRYLNSLVHTVVLVLCLTTVLLVVGTTARIFVFLLYLILPLSHNIRTFLTLHQCKKCSYIMGQREYVRTSSIIWVSLFVKEVRWSKGRRWQRSYPSIYIRVAGCP